MGTISEVATAFANREAASCHNARTDGTRYVLHNTTIAERLPSGEVRCTFGGWFTHTTANHINNVLRALGAEFRVSYAAARDGNSPETFIVRPETCVPPVL